MTTATRLGYRTDNPCVGVELPKSVATRDEMTVHTRDEFGLLLPLVAAKAPDELLFTNTVGSQLSSSRFWTTTWTSALDAACHPRRADGTPDSDAPRLTKRPRVHDLRHTHASWMIAAGTDLFVLQRRLLGHESITTTTETYAHLLPDQQRAAADAAGRAMGGLVRPFVGDHV